MANTTSGSSRRPVALLAYAFAITMMGTTLPTPLYPSYEQRFMFGQLTATVVFAVYALGVLATLFLLGETSDKIGRRPMLFLAIAASAVSSVIFIAADGMRGMAGVILLLVGRVFSGLSGGLMTGTATAALADAVPAGRTALASLVAALAQVIGLGLGPLVGSILLTTVPDPLRLIYVIYLVLLALAAFAIGAIPETVDRTLAERGPLVTPLPWSALLRQLNVTGLVGFAGFAVLGLFTGVCAAFLALSGHTDPLTTGLVVFSVFIASAIGQVVTARLPARPALLAGTVGIIVGIAIVGYSLRAMSVALLEVGGLIAGIGVGMSFRAALSVVTGSSPPDRRGEAASSFFVICYLGISLPIVGLGIVSRAFGLLAAGEALAYLIAAISVAVLVMLARRRPAATSA